MAVMSKCCVSPSRNSIIFGKSHGEGGGELHTRGKGVGRKRLVPILTTQRQKAVQIKTIGPETKKKRDWGGDNSR